MGFLSIIKAVDEFVYEAMSWLVFYPLTLFRTLRHPLKMMEYADVELDDSLADRYSDTLSPPSFLLVSLLLSHGIELALVGQSELVDKTTGLAGVVKDDSSLILLRLVLFSAFPMMLSLRLVQAQRLPITRSTLRPAFYSQCYVAAPFALALGLGVALAQLDGTTGVVGLVLTLVAVLAYTMIQIGWFARHLGVGLARAAMHAIAALALSIALVTLAAQLM